MQAYLIDSSIYIFRSYFSLPENWHASESGFPTQAVYGFTGFLLDILRQKQPQHLFCAFDESLGSGFRHQLCAQYKSNRELPDEALAFQFNACRQLCRVLGISEMASATFEADDLIGGVASKLRQADVQPVFVSRDKDLIQLVQSSDLYWDFGKSQPKTQAEVEAELEIGCGQMADLLDQLQDLPIRGAKKLADKLDAHRDQLFLSRQLATIVTDVDEAPGLQEISWQGIYLDAFELFCEEMGFGTAFAARAGNLKQRGYSAAGH